MNIGPIDHARRLTRLTEELQGGALLVLSQPEAYRNSTVGHHYRQDSFFHWLVGFDEPEAALVVLPFKPEGQRFHLFLREKDPTREQWDGRRLGVAAAKSALPIDEAYPIAALWDKLPGLLSDAERLYFNFGQSEAADRGVIKALIQHKNVYGKKRTGAKLPVYDAQWIAGRLRLRKGPEEIARMRAAAGATKAAFDRLYRETRPGMNERDLQGILVGEFLRQGAEMEAYQSIVASGPNACILHYHENDQELKDGEVVLVDAGAQYHYYASDCTRTFPVGRRFTPEQKAVYEIVLAAQKAAIAKARPGSSLEAIHDTAIDVLVDGLRDLKVLKGTREEERAGTAWRKYYPHGTSHWIGLDVHDVGVYHDRGAPVPLEPGMYFSVEPGLYFAADDETAPAPLRGIGVRIEDDVLVTDGGNEVLTAGIAKEIADLEDRH